MRRVCLAVFVLTIISVWVGLQSQSATVVDTAAAAAPKAESKKPFGLKKRVPWTTSKLTGSPYPPSPYKTEQVFPKLTFKNPVVLTNAPGTDRMFVVELDGKVVSFPNRNDVAQADPVIDLKKEIKGMTRAYGMTFHPKFAKNRFCYLSFVTKPEIPDGTRVSRFVMRRTDPPTIDPKSEKVIITWKSGGHNGACLKFGPDGFLYVSTGDGAGAFPPDSLDTGQTIDDLLASILRIDVDRPENGKAYAIPADNPFVKTLGARGEIWSYGHRNPWKMSFDSKTGDLWVGDVGWEMWEMIYRIRRGGNYGWSVMEASQHVHPERKRGSTPILPPTIVHSHTESRSITGGSVYRGKRLKELYGQYVYGDYVTGKLWAAQHDDKTVLETTELVDSSLQVICFGVDRRNELYVVGYGGGIHRLVKNAASEINRNFPTRLSETGLFSSTKTHRVAPGVIPYSINAEAWADHTTAERFVAIPGTGRLDVHTENNAQVGNLKGEWKFPTDTVLMKTVSIETESGNPSSRRRIETQVLHRDGDTWRPYNFIWNAEQSDAVLAEDRASEQTFLIRDKSAPGGKRRQTWQHASRTQCNLCHTTRAGTVHAFNVAQLDRPRRYGEVADNQLRTLEHVGLFAETPKRQFPAITNPKDKTADLDKRARAYLHVNCGHCHRRGGGGTAAMELVYHFNMKKTNLLDARPTQGTFGIHRAQVLAPGDPYRSLLYYRMAKLGRGRMPHFGSNVVDEQGLALIHRWIGSLKATDGGKTSPSDNERRLAKLRSAAPSRALKLVDELLSSTGGALQVSSAVLTRQLDPGLRKLVITKGSKHADPQVRDLFERFLPEEKRIKRLGTLVDANAILARTGDVARGRAIFFQTKGVTCINCHKIQGKGKDVGPDLTRIGKKLKRPEILESILQPSKKIEEKFRLYLVETKRGKVYTGLLASRTKVAVTLKDAQGKLIRIDAAEVETLVPQRKSIMPELQLRDMTMAQALDLLEFLTSLK